MSSNRRTLLAAAAGLVVADASIVTLALPELLRELDMSVEAVAAVLAVYAAVLAVSLIPAQRLAVRHGGAAVLRAGLLVFGSASAVCGLAGSPELLLAARAVQALGGAAVLVTAFATLTAEGDRTGRRLWFAAAVFAGAAGPALGGILTELLSWRAIFLAQVPVVLVAFIGLTPRAAPAPEAAGRPGRDEPAGSRWSSAHALRAGAALVLVSAALTAVLFLLVLLLVAGWGESPLHAALTVSVLPLAALAGSRIGGTDATRAAVGCVLVGGGTLALGFLPDARLWWTIAPQVAAGAGMGMALPALAGGLLPERSDRQAARLLTMRHVGVALILAALAPVVSSDLDQATRKARERGVALVLDARLPPQQKLSLAPDLVGGVDATAPRTALREAIARQEDTGPELDRLAERTDETLVLAVGEAFRTAFLITGALALIAAAILAAGGAATLAALLVAGALAGGYAVAHSAVAPEPVRLQDPCQERERPQTGGISGFLQDQALELLDSTACRLGSTREELVLALSDEQEAQRFAQRYGTDPGSLPSLLLGLFRG